MTARALAAVSVLLAAGAAGAQPVYRCGPDGAAYSQSPCPAGGVPVGTADVRSDGQRREAQAVADRQARLARQLEAERREREAQAAKHGAAGIKPLPPAAAAASATAKAHEKDNGKDNGKDKGKDKPKKKAKDQRKPSAATHQPSTYGAPGTASR